MTTWPIPPGPPTCVAFDLNGSMELVAKYFENQDSDSTACPTGRNGPSTISVRMKLQMYDNDGFTTGDEVRYGNASIKDEIRRETSHADAIEKGVSEPRYAEKIVHREDLPDSSPARNQSRCQCQLPAPTPPAICRLCLVYWTRNERGGGTNRT